MNEIKATALEFCAFLDAHRVLHRLEAFSWFCGFKFRDLVCHLGYISKYVGRDVV
jgi:hypothetical protein